MLLSMTLSDQECGSSSPCQEVAERGTTGRQEATEEESEAGAEDCAGEDVEEDRAGHSEGLEEEAGGEATGGEGRPV